MTDQQIIEALIARDEQVTEQFFFGNCRPLFLSIIGYVFSYEVDYDEFVNEFYLHLMENDAYRLRQFQGRSTVYQWMKVVATRFFIAKRNNLIENDNVISGNIVTKIRELFDTNGISYWFDEQGIYYISELSEQINAIIKPIPIDDHKIPKNLRQVQERSKQRMGLLQILR